MLSVAVVVLNWNGRHFLEKFIPFLRQTTYPGFKLVVADNASTDDSVDWIRTHHPDIDLIIHRTNEGFARGYNSALKQVNADIYVLLNSDVEVSPGWVEPVIRLFESDAGIGVVQPKILDWNHREYFEYAGAAGGWIDRYGYPFCLGRIFESVEKDQGQYEASTPLFWASGAALFIRSRVFHECGGFDPHFFAHQEEIDLCWRIQYAGHRIVSCPASVVYHVGGGTLPKGNRFKVFLNFRNNLIMLYKNLPTGEKWWKIPYRMLLDSISAWKNLLSGEPNYFFAVLKAHRAFVGWILFHQSTSLFPVSRKGRLYGVFRGNVVWKHFMEGKNTFSEIISRSSQL